MLRTFARIVSRTAFGLKFDKKSGMMHVVLQRCFKNNQNDFATLNEDFVSVLIQLSDYNIIIITSEVFNVF